MDHVTTTAFFTINHEYIREGPDSIHVISMDHDDVLCGRKCSLIIIIVRNV